MSWYKLPTELRQMILIQLSPTFLDPFPPEYSSVRAGYARVCREWQFFHKRHTFRRLVLDQDRLSDLDEFTSRVNERRSFVKEIHLRIRLADYDCTVCQLEEDEKSRKENNAIFTKAIIQLLTILSKWPERTEIPRDPALPKGISLDIRTFSPSDYQHGLREFWLQPDYPILFSWDAYADSDLSFQVERERAAQQLQADGSGSFHDPPHGWENGRQCPGALEGRKRVTQPLTLRGTLPTVNLITAFAMRRQSTRGIEPGSLKKILSAFPNLQHLTHEPWQAATAEQQQLFATEYLSLAKKLPKYLPHLQTLTLFQDSSPPFHSFPSESQNQNQHKPSNRALGRALSKTTRRIPSLKDLAASFLIDAYDFFHRFNTSQLGAQPPSNPVAEHQGKSSQNAKGLMPTDNINVAARPRWGGMQQPPILHTCTYPSQVQEQGVPNMPPSNYCHAGHPTQPSNAPILCAPSKKDVRDHPRHFESSRKTFGAMQAVCAQ